MMPSAPPPRDLPDRLIRESLKRPANLRDFLRLWQHWQAISRPRPTFHLHPVLPLVLYTGLVPWGSNRTIADLLAGPSAFHAFTPAFAPVFWNLADRTPEALLHSGAPWLQMLAVFRAIAAPPEDFQRLLGEVATRLATLADQEHHRWYELTRMAWSYAAFRRPAQEHPALQQAVWQANPRHPQEMQNMEKTMADVWFEQGELRQLRKQVRRFLDRRFQPLPEAVIQRIEQCTDINRLEAALDQAVQIRSLDELNL
jgi:hypothetical protein